jgi:hypothetical protein
MDDLNSDWKEFLRLLVAHRVRFVVVGAHAVAANGRPRLTANLDVFVDPTMANAKRVLAALEDFGFTDMGLTAARFARSDNVTMLGRVPFRIDILTGIDGVSFKKAWAGRLHGKLGKMRVAFLGRTELLKNKLASGRPKDLADVALLNEGTKRQKRAR